MTPITPHTPAQDLSESLSATAAQVRASVAQVRAGRGGIGSAIAWRVGQPDASGAAEVTFITNAHVVRAGNDSTFGLRLADGREIQATVAAIDPSHDLAALKAHVTGVSAAQIGDSSALRVGELVIAVGNPLGLEGAVTVGVVAARAPADPDMPVEPAEETERPEQREPENREGAWRRGRWILPRVELIQADLRLYPGNSGGPLTDARGRVIGVNAMIGGGLAFAIPSNSVKNFLAELAGQAAPTRLGVRVLTAPLTPALRQRAGVQQETAALVAIVEADSPAEAAGLLPGDVLLALDGRAILSADQLAHIIQRSPSGQPRTLSILRGGERRELPLTPTIKAAA